MLFKAIIPENEINTVVITAVQTIMTADPTGGNYEIT